MRIYKQGDEILISACDEKLIGRRFIEGKFQIDVSEKFYGGELVDKETLKRYLEDATIANLVGKETVDCAVKMGLINPDCILKVKGVPHAQMIKMI